jgi:hypothetical protein
MRGPGTRPPRSAACPQRVMRVGCHGGPICRPARIGRQADPPEAVGRAAEKGDDPGPTKSGSRRASPGQWTRFWVEQAEVTEQPARRAADRLSRQGGQFIAAIRLEEGAETDAVPLQTVEVAPQGRLVASAADDEVGVGEVAGKQGTGRFDGGVAGLDGLLCGREVLAHQHIDKRHLRHGRPPGLLTALAGTRTRTDRRLERPALPLSYESARSLSFYGSTTVAVQQREGLFPRSRSHGKPCPNQAVQVAPQAAGCQSLRNVAPCRAAPLARRSGQRRLVEGRHVAARASANRLCHPSSSRATVWGTQARPGVAARSRPGSGSGR